MPGAKCVRRLRGEWSGYGRIQSQIIRRRIGCWSVFIDHRVLEVFRSSDYLRTCRLPLTKLPKRPCSFPHLPGALLAERLVESLDVAEMDEMQKLWAAEAIRRRNEVRSGRVQPIPGEQVLAEVRRMVGR